MASLLQMFPFSPSTSVNNMSLVLLANCPVCGNDQLKPVHTCVDHTTSGETFHLQQCSHCAFLLTNPHPDEQSIGPYYESENYISHTSSKKTLLDKAYQWARSYNLSLKHDLVKEFASAKNILDFGCGTGHFLAYMKKMGMSTEGIEPSLHARTKASSLLKQVVYSSLEEVPSGQFEAITLWHVLEHIHQPHKTLTLLKERLTENGIIFIAVPNHLSGDAMHYQEYWAGYDVPRHLWHFTKDSMQKILHPHGLTIRHIEPMKLDAYYVSLLSEKYINVRGSKITQFMKGLQAGWLSNRQAHKTGEYSSLIYIVQHA